MITDAFLFSRASDDAFLGLNRFCVDSPYESDPRRGNTVTENARFLPNAMVMTCGYR